MSTFVATLSDRVSINSTSSTTVVVVARLQRRGRIVKGHVGGVDQTGSSSACGRLHGDGRGRRSGVLIMLAG